ncbi:MAG: NAD-dependent epimerase/dehydratase family protein [Anaerolineae bacterium]
MIFVTGATGFLGHNLIPHLLQAGHSVRALVRPTSDTTFLQEQGIELAVVDDISNADAIQQAMAGCDQVVHAAGLFRFWGDPSDFWQTNVAGTTAVLQAAISHQIKRFIHISTIVVVGKTSPGTAITEETLCLPQEPYQMTKREGEQLALAAAADHDLPVIILRPGAFYGPWGRYAFNRLFFEEPLRGWRIKVDHGRHITFPAFVPDVVQAIELALVNGRAGHIYNICSQSLSHNEANAIISDLAGIPHWRLHMPTFLVMNLARAWTAVSRFTHREPFYPINMAPYVFPDWRVSAAKAEKELGFRPTPFDQGAQKTLEWYWHEGILRPKNVKRK